MISEAMPISILVINIMLLGVLIFLFLYTYRKCFIEPLSSRQQAFFKLKLIKSVIFLIGNLCAYFVNYKLFFANPIEARDMFGDALTWVRFIDRGCMLIYGSVKLMDVLKYQPQDYDDLINEKEYIEISKRFKKIHHEN